MKRFIFRMIWNFCEFTGFPMGRFAPYIFGEMVGSKGVEVDSLGNRLEKK